MNQSLRGRFGGDTRPHGGLGKPTSPVFFLIPATFAQVSDIPLQRVGISPIPVFCRTSALKPRQYSNKLDLLPNLSC